MDDLIGTVHCCSWESLAQRILNNTIDLVVTSPPYNVGIDYGSTYCDTRPLSDYLESFSSWFAEVYRVLKPDGRLCLNLPKAIKDDEGNTYSVPMYLMPILRDLGYNVAGEITWIKTHPDALPAGTAWGSWLSASAPDFRTTAEHIYVLYKHSWAKTIVGRDTIDKHTFLQATTDTWLVPHDKKEHPAEFPFELAYRCIQLLSFVDDVVLDPFSGRGTTGVVALECGRRFLGSEINPEYADMALERIRQNAFVEVESTECIKEMKQQLF